MKQIPFDLGHRTAMGREDFLIAPNNQDAVAWIDLWPEGVSTPAVFMDQILAGAQRRAQALGYQLELHRAGCIPLNPDRLRQILMARSQWGFIIPPVPEQAMHFPLVMEELSGVTIGTSR